MCDRIHYFDQMKGLAILLVVIGHVMQFSFGYAQSDLVNMLGIFHMPIFFYISGYFAYKEIPSFMGLMKRLERRAMSLAFPYISFVFLWCLFSETNVMGLLLGGGGRYWFLYVLLLLSLFFMVGEYVIGKIKKDWLYIVCWLLPYCMLIFLKIKHIDIIPGGVTSHIVTYYRYFLIGYLCRKYIKLNTFLFKHPMVYALAFIFYFTQWYFCDSHQMLLIFAGGLGAIIVLQRFFELQTKQSKSMRLLEYMGENSLSIYVIHYFCIPDLSRTMYSLLDASNPFIWHLLFSSSLSLVIIAMSVFVGRLIENNSYLRLVLLGKLK